MQEAKNTARALVRIGYDGSVHKFFRGPKAEERFENELRVLRYLERRECDFVPRVLAYDREKLELVTSNCGARVEHLSDQRRKELFAELEQFGVRHDDPEVRNVTYRAKDGRFCVIDFEFAEILDQPAAAVDAEGVQYEATAATGVQGLRWSGMTDIGRFRTNNEDRFLTIAFSAADFYYLGATGEASIDDRDFVFAVSDGMGGERSGEFASKLTVDQVVRLLPVRFSLAPARQKAGIRERLGEVFQGVHRQLTAIGRSYEKGRNMGATLSLAWIVGGTLYFGHVGDGRIYHLPASGGMQQLTIDHTHVGWLRRSGQINEREARMHPRKNVLAMSLGAGTQYLDPQFGEIALNPGDRIVLCTDGVTDGLWDRGIEEIVRMSPDGAFPPQPPGMRLVRTAVAESGRDNATAIVLEAF
jgi:serine/threonine protein phosphatase PrpC